MIYEELFHWGEAALEQAGIAEAKLDARLLLEYVCDTNRNDLLVHGDREVEPEKQKRYEELIRRRSSRIPLQHITGTQEFMGLDFRVNEHVLIPRQDTEILVEEALKHLHDGMRVLDMCTGSGCILISLLHYSNDCEGVGADISVEALRVAGENAERILGRKDNIDGKEMIGSKSGEAGDCGNGFMPCVRFVRSNLFENINEKFDLIVSNPPYICSAVIETLEPEVRDHEPREALDGTCDGLFFYRRIVEECGKHLVNGGKLLLEIGYDQAQAVSELMAAAGFIEIEVIKDYAGLNRVVCGTLGFEKR